MILEAGSSDKHKNAPLSAYFYYQIAAQLARPADLYTSDNFHKLNRELAGVKPKGLPGDTPMLLTGQDGSIFSVTGLRIDTALSAIDLRVDANVAIRSPPADRHSL